MIAGDDVESEPRSPIHFHYLAHGGAAGVLGIPTSEEQDVAGPGASRGRICHFRGAVYGTEHGRPVRTPEEKVPASCHRPDDSGTTIESTVAWSAETGAHAVHGEIRALWLHLGGASGDLGYPTSDEMPTADGRGRRNQFQGGEIWWHPETGTAVRRG